MFRVFQNSGISGHYPKRLNELSKGKNSFSERLSVFFADRYNASHLLKPIMDLDRETFFTNGDDEVLQSMWAKQKGMRRASAADILLAQIEEHRTEVFYNTHPAKFDSSFVRRLPGHVRKKIAWHAAPGRVDMTAYDLVVCNFPSIRRQQEELGCHTAELFPAHDPVLDSYVNSSVRDIDVLFIGVFSRHHQKRTDFLSHIAQTQKLKNVAFHLSVSSFTKLAETPLGFFGNLKRHRRPKSIIAVTKPEAFGRQMYELLARAKIVINMAVDMAREDRGNMRCFEAMGSGAMLLSDQGNYPEGMVDGETLRTYRSSDDANAIIAQCLNGTDWQSIAANGYQMISTRYSKQAQWQKFKNLL